MGYSISLGEAVGYIQAFVEKIRPHERGMPLGGTIHKDGFWGANKEEALLSTGNMAWFCISPSLDYPRLFLAFEENSKYHEGEDVPAPVQGTLQYSKSVFGYHNEDIKNLLLTHTIDASNGDLIGKEIPKEKVIEFKRNFLAGIDMDIEGRPLNKYPYGFFENKQNQEVEKFTARTGVKYIRYYFGYDESTDILKKTNRIRIIVVGVDEAGKNMVPEMFDPLVGAPVILQKSWPPPPYS